MAARRVGRWSVAGGPGSSYSLGGENAPAAAEGVRDRAAPADGRPPRLPHAVRGRQRAVDSRKNAGCASRCEERQLAGSAGPWRSSGATGRSTAPMRCAAPRLRHHLPLSDGIRSTLTSALTIVTTTHLGNRRGSWSTWIGLFLALAGTASTRRGGRLPASWRASPCRLSTPRCCSPRQAQPAPAMRLPITRAWLFPTGIPISIQQRCCATITDVFRPGSSSLVAAAWADSRVPGASGRRHPGRAARAIGGAAMEPREDRGAECWRARWPAASRVSRWRCVDAGRPDHAAASRDVRGASAPRAAAAIAPRPRVETAIPRFDSATASPSRSRPPRRCGSRPSTSAAAFSASRAALQLVTVPRAACGPTPWTYRVPGWATGRER